MTRNIHRDGLRGSLDTMINTPLMTDLDPFWVYCQEEVRALVDAHDLSESDRARILDMLGLAS